jgi:protein-L-isoaspartate(D-aspartate) O-methyltransferase
MGRMGPRGRDWLAAVLPALSGCGGAGSDGSAPAEAPLVPAPEDGTPLGELARARLAMVETQLIGRDLKDPRVLKAMATVPRHEFVSDDLRAFAYDDRPLPIGYDVTISQPYIVALMSELAEVEPGERVLDVGTGSGYQAAVLAELGAEVWSVEIIREHAEAAGKRLADLGYENVHVRHGDGWQGWPEHAPYDAIVVAAAPDEVPPALLEQLAIGGRLVIPVGTQWRQELRVLTRTREGTKERRVIPVLFVPLVKDD